MRFWKSLIARLMLLGVLVAPISFILPVNAQAGQVTLNPTDDAYTDGYNINTNYGSAPTLKASLSLYCTWLKFDLSTIPEDAFGITAILELYTYYGGVINPSEVVAFLVLTDFNNFWSEDTITQANMPHDASAYAELSSDYVANEETWYEWLVTEAVVNATANNATAVTIVMRHPLPYEILPTIFTSKEGSLTKKPKLTVTWTGINQRPIAILDVDKTNPNVNETVTFDASASTDDGIIDQYFFDFGDGTNSSWTPLSMVTHEYASEDTYNATLIVMDDFGVTSLESDFVYAEITVVPEFPSILILPLFMITTLLAVIIYRRKHSM